jgi:hypothetical protein
MVFKTLHLATDLKEAAGMRKLSGEEVYTDPEALAYIQEQFAIARANPNAVPVLVPAHNEGSAKGRDPELPISLLSLARTEGDVYPIVINNRSSDNTAEMAAVMGAVVLEAPMGKKMAATQRGIDYVCSELGAEQVLLSDADTFFPRNWPVAMSAALDRADRGRGSAIFGTSITSERGRITPADVLVTANNLRRAITSTQNPVPRGHNYGIRFDRDGKIQAAIAELNPDTFEQDDVIIAKQLAEVTDVAGSKDPGTFVYTVNDRLTSLGQVVGLLRGGSYVDLTSESYAQEYGPRGL